MNQLVRKVSTQDDNSLVNEFVSLALLVTEYARLANCRLIPYSNPQTPHFRKLELNKKVEVLNFLRTFTEICAAAYEDGEPLGDSISLTWYALKRFGMRFGSDLFDKIQSHNIVEVYTKENIQIFRNFRFFDVVSYSLEDVLCRPWPELFVREDSSHTNALLETAQSFYTGKNHDVVSFEHLGKQKLTETDSPFRLKINLIVNHLAPIYDSDWNPVGLVAIESGELASPMPDKAMAEALLQSYYGNQPQDEI